ncbi:MAG: hypothetical protein IT460_12485 [Planctomycetes bacterium]|nr:hypothetical protein [Planctomycetota bacterium]
MSTARALLLVGAAAVALAWAAPARAADAPCAAPCAPPERPRALGTAGFLPGVPLEDDRGDVSVARYALDLEGEHRLGARWKATWGVGVQRADYRFEDADRLVPGDGRLLDEAWRVSVAPGVSWDATDDWRLSAAFGVTATFAPGADVLDATTGSVLATVRRRLSPSRGVTVGAVVATNLEDSATIVPVAWVDGGDGPTGAVRVEFRGAGVRVLFDVTDRLALGASARYDRLDVRLAEHDRVPDGVFRDVRVPVGVELEWRASARVRVGGAVGLDVWREVSVDDRHGRTIVEAEQAEPGVWFGFGVSVDL